MPGKLDRVDPHATNEFEAVALRRGFVLRDLAAVEPRHAVAPLPPYAVSAIEHVRPWRARPRVVNDDYLRFAARLVEVDLLCRETRRDDDAPPASASPPFPAS